MDQPPLWHVGRTKRGQLYSVLSAATWWSPDDDERAVARLLSALQANKKYPTALVHVRSGVKSGFVDFSRWPAQDAVFCSCGSCGAGRKLALREFEAHGRVPGENMRSAWAFKMDIRLATYIWCTRYRGDVRGAALLEYVRQRYPGTRYPIIIANLDMMDRLHRLNASPVNSAPSSEEESNSPLKRPCLSLGRKTRVH